ncbi:MAG: histidine kinase [Muribaculaceae bacterium]|nr:histidine kinase [Muribaculaceae bacterium]
MSKGFVTQGRLARMATVVIISLVLFYLPSALTILREGVARQWVLISVVMSTVYTAMFCLNYFVLVPMSLKQTDGKFSYFIINTLVILVVCALVVWWLNSMDDLCPPNPKKLNMPPPDHPEGIMHYVKFVMRDGIMMILSAALGYAVKIGEERENLRRRELEISAEQRKMELTSLKAQLNPHFLFNSLNSIYALIGLDPVMAQEALHNLSRMLRFMIYDSDSVFVPLDKDAVFIGDYVRLMKLRLPASAEVSYSSPEFISPTLQVAPLVFLTLVENAFKHAAPDSSGEYYIRVALSIEEGRTLRFSVINSVSAPAVREIDSSPKSSSSIEDGKRIGLENVSRQLGLLYPGSHVFDIYEGDNYFSACIEIEMKALEDKNQKM